MQHVLWLVPALPLLGSIVLMLGTGRLSHRAEALIGVLSVGLAAVIVFAIAGAFLLDPPAGAAYKQALWRWFAVGHFSFGLALRVDPLSLLMMLITSGVGFLIHLFSTEFMEGEDGYGRFFAYLNLFVAAMLLLVMADNFLALYAGWEGVGLCSYLLIGFWWRDPANGLAARKAFIVTRVGDTAFLVGLLLIASRLGTLNIAGAMQEAAHTWHVGSPAATLIAFLLLGGAVGKSAQLPLQTWLPDAMAGPTPVSALIHAATMVTAGVYLIARTHVLFLLAPAAEITVGIVGAATLLLAGFSALAQNDIKRILAYSTMSQIGYMFLALGVGAWRAAMFHFMTHAFFKALLFLSAGAVTMRLHHEQDIYRMGGLARRLPAAFWSFLIGSAALAALPLITSGFYSKEAILSGAWADGNGGRVLWLAGVIGAFVTGIYIFRAVFIAFFGEEHTHVSGSYGWRVIVPLVVLSVLSLAGGFIELPSAFGHVTLLSRLLTPVLPPTRQVTDITPLLLASAASILGIALAAVLYWRPSRPPAETPLWRFWHGAAGFDLLYDRLLVRPVIWAARVDRDDVIDSFYDGIALATQALHRAIRRTQTGRVRLYAASLAIGSVGLIAIAVLR
ncbi:MAG: NADH-quinone oxidoreductase subunit L [Acidiphilium sp. 37-67-22]|nr:MAG: NADH-quinone oxidoreductase subunit L [Acidiphilium sp. 37-67-22]